MRLRHTLPLSLALVLSGCQSLLSDATPPPRPSERWQGELRQTDGHLRFTPCGEQRAFAIPGDAPLPSDALALLTQPGHNGFFADLRGHGSASSADTLTIRDLYRLQTRGSGCADPAFRRLLVHAEGQSPDWTVDITSQGLLLRRPDQPPLALPYLEEQLAEGRASFSSEADGHRLELWVAPQACTDTAGETFSHLGASLRLDGQLLRGCAWYGGARD